MKCSLPTLLAGALIATAAVAAAPRTTDFSMPIDGGPELTVGIDFISIVDGRWNILAHKFEKTDDGFEGTLTPSEGGPVKFTGTFKKSGEKWECSLKWTADAETPNFFLLGNIFFPTDDVRGATVTSGSSVISFDKLIEKVNALTTIYNATEFSVGPVNGTNLGFTAAEQSDVGVVIGTENVCVRLFLTPVKGTLPASGSVSWTVGKQ